MTKSPAKPLRFPADPSLSPTDLLLGWLEANEKSQKQFASESGFSEALVSMLLNNKRRFSSGILSQVATTTGTDESEWVRHQQAHEEWSKNADFAELKGVIHAFRAGILGNRDIRLSIKKEMLSIEPLSDANIKECSIDLTLGSCKRLSLAPWLSGKPVVDSREFSLRDDRHLIAHPGETWLAWAAESVHLSASLCGRIGARSDLVLAGAILTFGTQINPGWSGIPFVTLYNPTAEIFELDSGQPFMTLEIHALSSAAELPATDAEP